MQPVWTEMIGEWNTRATSETGHKKKSAKYLINDFYTDECWDDMYVCN